MGTRNVIAVIGSECKGSAVSLLAQNLAVEAAGTGHKVLLLDTTSAQHSMAWAQARSQRRMRPKVTAAAAQGQEVSNCLEHIAEHFDQIIVDGGIISEHSSRCALIAAGTALVTLDAGSISSGAASRLAASVNEARFFNPGLRVRCVLLSHESNTDPASIQWIQSDIGRLSATSLDMASLQSGAAMPGRCCRDLPGSASANAIAALYEDIVPLGAPHHLLRAFRLIPVSLWS